MSLKSPSKFRIGSLTLASVLALTIGLGAGGLVMTAGSVVAQTQEPPAIAWDARRLAILERNVRRLDRALTQRNAAGDPVILAPDPEVVALMGRVDLMDRRLSDLEATLVRLNDEAATLTAELEGADRTNRDLAGRVDALTRRLAELEAANAEAEAAAAGTIAPRSPSGSEGGDFDAAVRLIRDGETEAAAEALQLFIVTWPESGRLAEAHYRLADIRAAGDDEAGAVQDYARALRGWPTTGWAPEATVKLAAALLATDRAEQACQALGEFQRRYAAGASPAVRTRAGQIDTQAECG